MDEYGRLTPATNRFPSAAGGKGFRPLADYIHAKGLKFGIHIMRGIPRRAVAANLPVFGSKARAAAIADTKSLCPWNTDMYGVDMSKPGAQDYYDSILQLYAQWGVDYIKADDIASPFHGDEIAALHRAIVKLKRAAHRAESFTRPGGPGEGRFLCRQRQHVAHLRRFLGRWRTSAPVSICSKSGARTRGPAPGRTPTCCRSAASEFAPSAATIARRASRAMNSARS
jgi:alpha-galactosidase